MQIKRILSLALVMLFFLCLTNGSVYGQRRNRSKGKEQTQKTQPPAPYPNLDPADYRDKKPICSLTLEQAPTVRGFRLGMSVDELTRRLDNAVGRAITSRLGQVKNRATYTGLFSIGVEKYQFANVEEADGLEYIGFRFLDERLYQITIHYSYGAEWQNVSQFVEVISPVLKLNQKWDVTDERAATLDCGVFKVEAGLNVLLHLPDLTITDSAGNQEAEKRKEEQSRREQEEEEKRRRDFKP
jgi:hypothetical protein